MLWKRVKWQYRYSFILFYNSYFSLFKLLCSLLIIEINVNNALCVADNVQKQTRNLHGAYGKRKKSERDFYQAPSGSSAWKGPKMYKYASELAFLDPRTVSSAIHDNLSQVRYPKFKLNYKTYVKSLNNIEQFSVRHVPSVV